MVNSFLKIVGNGDKLSSAFVWGSTEGHEGAQIEILGLNNKPVYLNKFMLPDIKQETTQGEFAKFAFHDLEKGPNFIRAKFKDGRSSTRLINLEEGYVSVVNLSPPKTIKTQLSLSNIFTKEVPAMVRFMQDEKFRDIQEASTYKYSKGLQFIDIDAGSQFPNTRFFYSQNLTDIQAQTWPLKFLDDHILDKLHPDSAVVVGRVGEDFIVDMSRSIHKFSNIGYFDQLGNPTTTGIAGGGFVIYNHPVGLHSISIRLSSGKIINRILLLNSNYISTINEY